MEGARARTGLRLAGRASVNAIDQGVSSITNAGLSIWVAVNSSQQEFGLFAVSLIVINLLLQVVRQAVSVPFMLTAPRRSGSGFSSQVGSVASAAIAIGLIFSAGLSLVVGVMISSGTPLSGLAATVLASAAVLPAVFYQDFVRHVAFSVGKPAEALISDAIWLFLLGVSVMISSSVWSPGAAIYGEYEREVKQ